MATGNNAKVTLAGNRTLGTPSNIVAGQAGVLAITQGGTGSFTLAYASVWKFAGGSTPTLSTAAGAKDVLAFYAESGTSIFTSVSKDYK